MWGGKVAIPSAGFSLWRPMTRILLGAVLFAASQIVLAQAIEYEIYELSKAGLPPKLVAKGKRQYSLNDVEVQPYKRDGRPIAEKFIELEKGFKVGARIFLKKELNGFGLLARKSNFDFSWEWYDKEKDNLYKKFQGPGRVMVKAVGMPEIEELAEVTFLEDTRLRFVANGQGTEDTHHILIKAGSVLRFK
jgi:hypothetical protein